MVCLAIPYNMDNLTTVCVLRICDHQLLNYLNMKRQTALRYYVAISDFDKRLLLKHFNTITPSSWQNNQSLREISYLCPSSSLRVSRSLLLYSVNVCALKYFVLIPRMALLWQANKSTCKAAVGDRIECKFEKRTNKIDLIHILTQRSVSPLQMSVC